MIRLIALVLALGGCASLSGWPPRDELVAAHFDDGAPDSGWFCVGNPTRRELNCHQVR